jgi:hypothetical protein
MLKKTLLIGQRINMEILVNYLLIALCFIFLIDNQGVAVTIPITTAEGNGADSYIVSDSPNVNVNYGLSDVISIKHDSGSGFINRKGYLRFDLTEINDIIVDVSLELTFVSAGGSGIANPSTYYVYGLINGHTGKNWDELTITWNNAPANNQGSGNGFLAAEVTFLGSFDLAVLSAEVGDKVTFTSNELINFLQKDTNNLVTLMLTREQRNFSNEHFASKENATLAAPTIFVTVPEPATILILGLGGLASLLRRKAI